MKNASHLFDTNKMARFLRELFLFALAVGFSSAGEEGSLCRFVLNDSSGQFTSPGYPGDYPNEAVCTWEIQAPAGKRIRLRFTEFHLEASSGCSNDYLEIFDGEEFQTYCGRDAPPETESKGNTMSVVLSTDELINVGGKFAADYETFDGEDLGDCSASLDLSMQPTWAFMWSPHHPDQYPNNHKCRYDILWQRTGENLDRFSHVAFLRFKTAGNATEGTGDLLKIYRDGEEDKRYVLGGNYQFATGNYKSYLPHMSVPRVANLSLAFASDGQDSDGGFLFAVTSELNEKFPKVVEQKEKLRMKKKETIDRRWSPSDSEAKDVIHINMAEKTIHSTDPKLQNLAGFGSPHDPRGSQDVYDYGYFMSPNHPGEYEPLTDIRYNITAPPGQKVAIALLRLAIEDGAPGGHNDFLGLRDGDTELGWTWFSGHQPTMSYVWTSNLYNYAIARFYSDGSVQYSGFLAAFAAVEIDWPIDLKKKQQLE